MSGRWAKASTSKLATPARVLGPHDFLASVGLSAFRSAVASRVLYKEKKHPTRLGTPLQSHPVLRNLGQGIDHLPTKKRHIQRVYRQSRRILKDHFPHLTGGVIPKAQAAVTGPPVGNKRFDEPKFPLVKYDRRSIFINLRPKDKVRIIPGGPIPADSKWVKPQKVDKNLSQVWEITSVDATKNTVLLDKVWLVQGSPIPQDRNKSSRPMGTFQEVSKRDIQIEIPMANVQLLVPQTVVVENLKDVGLWTQEREDALPAQIFALKIEERNIVPPSTHSRIQRHEKYDKKNPWEYELDELEVRGPSGEMEPRLYSWDRFVTETTPSMDPRLRIDVNVPFEKMVPRKKLDESTSLSPLATPSSIVLARTWEPPTLSDLGPSLFFRSPDLPNAYLSSLASAANYANANHAPSNLPFEIPSLLTPSTLPPSDIDSAFSEAEMAERRAMWKDKVEQSRQAREDWTTETAKWKAEAMEDSLDPTLPMEFFVSNELSNYYGRFKMDFRYEARKLREEKEKEEFVREAVRVHFEREKRVKRGEEPRIGRVMGLKEVTLTAERRYAEMWVDRQHDYEERKKRDAREKWGPSKWELKNAKRQKKKSMLADKLRRIMLVPSKNQVIPEGLEDTRDRTGGKGSGRGGEGWYL